MTQAEQISAWLSVGALAVATLSLFFSLRRDLGDRPRVAVAGNANVAIGISQPKPWWQFHVTVVNTGRRAITVHSVAWNVFQPQDERVVHLTDGFPVRIEPDDSRSWTLEVHAGIPEFYGLAGRAAAEIVERPSWIERRRGITSPVRFIYSDTIPLLQPSGTWEVVLPLLTRLGQDLPPTPDPQAPQA